MRSLSLGQRRFVFIMLIIGGLLFIGGITVFLIANALNAGRSSAVSLLPDVNVSEFSVLPGDDVYPESVVVAPDGTVYTGSYATGAIWAITSAGEASELPGSRNAIGAAVGLALAGDGSLLIVDQVDTDPRTIGGVIQRIAPDGTVDQYAYLPDERGFIAPNDIAVDGAGAFYVSDPGRNEVWRFTPNANGDPVGEVWWVPPTPAEGANAPRNAVTGLAYDATRDALIVTDPEINRIYRVAVADGATEIIYEHGTRPNAPGFDGITVAPDGTLYVAALGQNGVARVNLEVENGELDYIAGLFRGSSDVAYAPESDDLPQRLYVTNFDQSALILPLIRPGLPFALDVVELEG